MNTVKEILSKYTIEGDIIKTVDTITENSYCLNERFSIIREGKEYFLTIKLVDVTGEIIKHHTRLEIDSNLPQQPKTKREIKIERLKKEVSELELKMNSYKQQARQHEKGSNMFNYFGRLYQVSKEQYFKKLNTLGNA
jgi:hypothetical protein